MMISIDLTCNNYSMQDEIIGLITLCLETKLSRKGSLINVSVSLFFTVSSLPAVRVNEPLRIVQFELK